LTRVQNGEKVTLSNEERQLLQNDQNFAERLAVAMAPQIDRENAENNAASLGISYERYQKMNEDIENGMDKNSALAKQQLSEARSRGYLTIEEYYKMPQQQAKAEAQQKANDYLDAQKRANVAGYFGVDEYAYFRGHQQDWTPKASQILKAHELGLTSKQYMDFLHQVALGEEDALQLANKDFTPEQIQEQEQEDYQQLQNDLKTAGYNSLDYNTDFTINQGIASESFDYDQKKQVRQALGDTETPQSEAPAANDNTPIFVPTEGGYASWDRFVFALATAASPSGPKRFNSSSNEARRSAISKSNSRSGMMSATNDLEFAGMHFAITDPIFNVCVEYKWKLFAR